jgi:hypothetical protein
VNRRGFITLFGGVAALPLAARAQQPMRRVAVLCGEPRGDAEDQAGCRLC